MAAGAVSSHCEDYRDNGYLEQNIPRQKIGCDDEVNADYCTLARRCASSCMERDLALEKTVPLSSQVGAQTCFQPLLPCFMSRTTPRCGAQ